MKKAIVALILFAAMVNCGGGSSPSSSSSLDFYAKTEEVTPVVTPSTSASMSKDMEKATWSSGNNLYQIYQLIREYIDARDAGVIDGSNMHKAMYEASSYVDQALAGCVGTTNEDGSITPSQNLITQQSITPPFEFGDDLIQQTYDCAFTISDSGTVAGGGTVQYTKSFAIRQSGTAYYMLMGVHSYESGGDSPSAMQVEYDTGANTMKVNNAYLVNYTTGEKYAVRIHVDGNISTHLFSMKLFKYGSEGMHISIAGHGYSQGAGNYYLFRVTMAGTNQTVTDSYYCFSSDTTEAEMQIMDDSGAETVPSACADLEADLPDNYNIDASEVPTSDASFTGGGDSLIELSWQ